jgi:hypothetical protein
MKIEIEIQNPDVSGVPGRAREILAKLVGWDRMRKLCGR